MKRRQAIQTSVFLAGCGLSAGTIAAIVSSCSTAPADSGTTFLGDDNVALLGDIVETIIPATDTPGAREAGIHEWMDQSVRDNFSQEESEMFKTALSQIRKDGFSKMSQERKEDYLTSIESEEGQPNVFEVLRGMTCQGFFSSEIGATQVLAFDPIPGEWRGCIDLAEVGKAWA